MRTKVLGCSVCKQEAGGLAVEAVFIGYMFRVLSNTSWYGQLYYPYYVVFFLVLGSACTTCGKKKKVLRVGSCSGSVISL